MFEPKSPIILIPLSFDKCRNALFCSSLSISSLQYCRLSRTAIIQLQTTLMLVPFLILSIYIITPSPFKGNLAERTDWQPLRFMQTPAASSSFITLFIHARRFRRLFTHLQRSHLLFLLSKKYVYRNFAAYHVFLNQG